MLTVKNIVPPIMVALAVILMVWISRTSGRSETMLPTFGALLTGAWLMPQNLWHYSSGSLLISLPLAACVGLLISLILAPLGGIWVYPGIYMAFVAAAAILIAGRTQLYPCFGAAALPVLFHTSSWLYPLSVTCMAAMLVAGRSLLVQLHLRKPLEDSGFPEHRKERALYYLQTSMGLLPALLLVAASGFHYVFLPPMFVTYATFCNAKSTFTRYPVCTWFQIVIAISVGTLACWFGEMFGSWMPAHTSGLCALMAGVAVTSTMIFGKLFHRLFPPAMSFAITPFLIHPHPWVILSVAGMSAYFIFVAWLMRNHPMYENHDLHYL